MANRILLAITAAIGAIALATGMYDPFIPYRDGGSPAGLLLHAFAHGGVLHLAGNLWFLWLFGNPVNARLGHATYVAIYLGAAAAGGIAWLAASSGVAVVGASGAVMGVAGAFLVLFPRNAIRGTQEPAGHAEVRGFWFVLLHVAFVSWRSSSTRLAASPTRRTSAASSPARRRRSCSWARAGSAPGAASRT